MLTFLVRIFAVIGFLITLVILIGVGIGMYRENAETIEPSSTILALDFTNDIVEQEESSPLSLALHKNQPTPLLDILRAIDRAKDDPHVKGIVARFGGAQPTLAQAQEIRAAILRFRTAKDKFTYAYGPSYGDFGLGNRAYFLASTFENIWLQPVGAVGLSGLALQSPFGKEALSKIGVTADFMRREEYKSFSEMTTRDDFSAPVRANMQSMLEDLEAQEISAIAENRKWAEDRVKRLMEAGPYTDDEAVQAGLVTHIGYEDELNDEIDQKAGTDTKHVDVESYLTYRQTAIGSSAKSKVALIYGTGLIVDKAVDGDIGGEHVMGADDIVDAFNSAIEDGDVKAILFRVDSPGGSPDASESIRRAVLHAQKKGKPVIVSMGGTAASGGYWISMSADKIVAEPGTITGSIGVLAGKMALGGLMQKLGIHWDTLKTNSDAGMWSMIDEFSPAQRARVNALLDRTYAAFTKDVSDARKIPIEKMPDVAKGRVWTGSQAVKIGLVDQLGGYDMALASIRKKLNLGEKDPLAIEQFPAPETPVERMLKLLRGFGAESTMIRSGLAQWQAFTAVMAPLWNALAASSPVSARIPLSTNSLRL